jgi:hypothetical protein
MTKLPNNFEQQNYLSTNKEKVERRGKCSQKSLHVKPVVTVWDTKGKLMGNYVVFLDTREKRCKSPLLCKIIVQNKGVKLER